MANTLSVSSGKEKQDWNMQDLRTVDELTITEESNVKDLSFINDLPNITKLTIKDYEGSLNGIQRAYKLTYLYFDNTNGKLKIDYSGVKGLVTLTELYFINPTNEEVEKLFTEMSKTDYTKLTTVKICGEITNYENGGKRYKYTYKSNFTNIGKNENNIFDLLTISTREKIQSLDVSNNNISFIDLEKFSSLNDFSINNNNLSVFPNLCSKAYGRIDMGDNQLTNLNIIDNLTIDSFYIDANDLTSLVSLIGHVKYTCWATDMNNLDFISLTEDQKKSISSISLFLDSKYSLAFPTQVTIVPTDCTNEQFRQITGSEAIRTLKLTDCKLIDDSVLQEVIASLKNLSCLCLDGTKITSLSCIKSSLYALSIRNTAVNDLSPVFDMGVWLLRLNNADNIINYYNSSDESYKNKTEKFFENIGIYNLKQSQMPGFDGWGRGGLCTDTAEDLAKLINTFKISTLNSNYENGRIFW